MDHGCRSSDAVSSSSASLMMIAHQYFQQQNQHQQQQPPQQNQQEPMWEWNAEGFDAVGELEIEEEIDVGVYLDGFSPRPQQQQQQQSNTKKQKQSSSSDWMDCLMMSSCVSDPSSDCSSDLIGGGEEVFWRQQQQQQHQNFPGDDLEERQMQLSRQVSLCIKEIESGELQGAGRRLRTLKSMASSSGDPVQKSAYYFAAALESRLGRSPEMVPGQLEVDDDEDLGVAYKTLNDACPYLKFAHLTANQALLEATDGATRIHIIDFGTMQGVQWAAFLQAFATWSGSGSGTTNSMINPGKRSLRITGIPSPHLGPDPGPAMMATQRRLVEFARLLGVDFEFCPVLVDAEGFSPGEHLRVEADEVVAINLLVQLADLPARALESAFGLVERLNPRVVTVAEYEVGEEVGDRVRFYSAVFESLDVAMQRDDPERVRAEGRVFGREIWRSLNLNRGGLSRLGRFTGSGSGLEPEPEWQRRVISNAGLWSAPMSNYSVSQARLLLWLHSDKSDGFNLVQAPGSLTLAWRGTNIVTVSTWHC